MRAFISYAIGHNEQYILNLLGQKLAERGMTLVTGLNQQVPLDYQARSEIQVASLFIGLITGAGAPTRSSHVLTEFKHANLFQKPSILLIEDSVAVGPWIPGYENTIRFNRHNIDGAIQEVRNRIDNTKFQDAQPNAAAWLLGGIAVLALLSYLSDDKK